MTKTKVYLIIQTVLCIGLAAMLVSAVIGIYREGVALKETGDALAWIYTKEKAADAFAPVAPVFFGAIGLMIAGLVLGIKDARAEKPVKDAETTRNLLLSRIKEPSEALKKEKRTEQALQIGGWIVFGLCMVPVLIYLLQPAHFPADDLEGMFSSLLWGILPWTALGTGCLLISLLLRGRSIRRQIETAKQQLKQKNTTPVLATESVESAESADSAEPVKTAKTMEPTISAAPTGTSSRLITIVRIILIAAAVAMIVAGVLNGSMRDVLIKAINLCTECVGLG